MVAKGDYSSLANCWEKIPDASREFLILFFIFLFFSVLQNLIYSTTLHGALVGKLL
jgi:hypothetical protein